jgi:predicted ATPase with chaperone activity
MLARRLTTILPAMTLVEAIETTRIHRVAGLTGDRTALVTTRPFRARHHTISDVELIVGGHVPMPGEVSLAYHGVRFLDLRLRSLSKPVESWKHDPMTLATELALEFVDREAAVVAFPLQHTKGH